MGIVSDFNLPLLYDLFLYGTLSVRGFENTNCMYIRIRFNTLVSWFTI